MDSDRLDRFFTGMIFGLILGLAVGLGFSGINDEPRRKPPPEEEALRANRHLTQLSDTRECMP